MARGHAPDLMAIGSPALGQFSVIDGLVDLGQPPYNVHQYKDDLAPDLWKTVEHLGNQHIFAMPIFSTPMVTYYRADLLQQVGFPAEPEALAAYMEDAQNWIELATALKRNGSMISPWTTTPLGLYNSTQHMFDEDLEYRRNSIAFYRAYYLSQRVNLSGLSGNVNVWNQSGQEALASDRLAMVYLGSAAEDILQQYVPQQSGKWRATRLPFGLHGWSDSTSLAISQHSLYKEEAWSFIQFMRRQIPATGEIPASLQLRKQMLEENRANPYFGGQRVEALYVQLANQMKEYRATPMDQRAAQIASNVVNDSLRWNDDAGTAFYKLETIIKQELGDDITILQQSLR